MPTPPKGYKITTPEKASFIALPKSNGGFTEYPLQGYYTNHQWIIVEPNCGEKETINLNTLIELYGKNNILFLEKEEPIKLKFEGNIQVFKTKESEESTGLVVEIPASYCIEIPNDVAYKLRNSKVYVTIEEQA